MTRWTADLEVRTNGLGEFSRMMKAMVSSA